MKVPAGVEDGTHIRLSGEGDAGVRGGPSGHLDVLLHVEPHDTFTRQDNDLIYDLRLNVAEAALGISVEVPTLDGEPVGLEVEPGTQHGHVFVVRGRGVPFLRGSGRGDLLVRTHVVTPTKVTAEQRELLEQLARSLGTPSVAGEDGSLFGRIRDALS